MVSASEDLDFGSFYCLDHPKCEVVYFLPNNNREKVMLCYQCDAESENSSKYLDKLKPHEYIEKVASFRKAYRTLLDNTKGKKSKKTPKAFGMYYDEEAEALKKVKDALEAEKGRIEYCFDKLMSDLRALVKSAKEKALKEIDAQLEAVEKNFYYYRAKVIRYFPEGEDEEEEPEDIIEDPKREFLSAIKRCADTNDLNKFIKDVNDDLDDLIIYSIYQKDDNRKLAMKKAITALEKHLLTLSEAKPRFKLADDSLSNLKGSLEDFLKDTVVIEKPIHTLRIANCYFDSNILTTMKQHDQIREWVDLSKYGSIIQLAYRASRDGFTPLAFHLCVGDATPTLVLVKTTGGRIFGGFSDISWSPRIVSKYHLIRGAWESAYRTSFNSFVFCLDTLMKVPIDLSQRDYAIYVDRGKWPCFGRDLLIEKFPDGTNRVTLKLGEVYNMPEKDFDLTGAFLGKHPEEREHKIEEIEVFNFFF